jgi:hypothetical protein
MGELIGHEECPRPAGCFGQNMKNLFSAGNPEHVETPEGIE